MKLLFPQHRMAELPESERLGEPFLKKSKISDSKPRKNRQNFQRVHDKILRHQEILCKALKELDSDWASFCFVKIVYCNAHQSCSVSGAYCETERNLQALDHEKRRVVWIPDLFDVSFVQRFINLEKDEENQIFDKHLIAFEKLADFLDKISGTNKILEKQLKDDTLKDAQWAAVLGTHVLRKIAVYDDMKIDEGFSDLLKECPCGCRSPINICDNSMGHQNTWHGSVDIRLGPVAVSAYISEDEDEIGVQSNTAFELKRKKLENMQNQLIPESIIFAFAMRGGVVPLVGISKRFFKVYMYDPDNDLLYESTTMPLFLTSVEGRKLYPPSLVVLWLVVNHSHFFTGVKSSHVEFGYEANLYNFLKEDQFDIYRHKMRFGGLRHVKTNNVKFIAGMNKGMFKRL